MPMNTTFTLAYKEYIMKKYSVVVYISGKITEKTAYKQRLNVLLAERVNRQLWELGFTTICPHTNAPKGNISYRDYIDGDITLLARSDCVLMMNNWKESNGAKEELQFAYQRNIPVFFSIEELVKYWSQK